MIPNGTIVAYYGNSTVGRIVGKTEEGYYLIASEDGEIDKLALTEFEIKR
jgi:hypothetical protein